MQSLDKFQIHGEVKTENSWMQHDEQPKVQQEFYSVKFMYATGKMQYGQSEINIITKWIKAQRLEWSSAQRYNKYSMQTWSEQCHSKLQTATKHKFIQGVHGTMQYRPEAQVHQVHQCA